ncbi:hypothetical protein V22_22740 [Calycomorphotria hydatis]|uniref:Uncharacterized protein n=2 Tax=Calycomorphotria hydatis TaxID=2528027 RepID=A0A517T9I7_9PLAN|nr:hypothetical protein V22_22740 [Calycomorphotria hydatis]
MMLFPCILFLSGCGYDAYEYRFTQNTIPYFVYKDKVESNLEAPWKFAQISFRPPKPFKELPPPKATKSQGNDSERESRRPPVDPRQPRFLRSDLVGLAGAFRGDLQLEASDAASAGTAPAYIYILSNIAMKRERDVDLSQIQFDLMSVNRVLEGMGLTPISPQRLSTELSSYRVGGKKFAPQKQYKRLRFIVDDVLDANASTLVELFFISGGPVQVCVLMFLPENSARSENMNERTELMLESLAIRGKSGSSPAPAGGAPGF